MNSGSTTYQLALRMPRSRSLQLVTTSLEIAAFLAPRGLLDVHILGGRVNPDSINSTGSLSEKALDEFYYDVSFIGVEAVDLNHGITSSYLDAAYETKIVEHSRKTVILCDSSKFGRVSNVLMAPVKAVDLLITDCRLDAEIADAYKEAGVEVELAGPMGENNG